MANPDPPTLPSGDDPFPAQASPSFGSSATPVAPAPPRGSVARRLGAVLAVVALIVGFAALRVYLSEHRAIPLDVFADAIAERFSSDPSLVQVLCTQPVLLLRRVRATAITSVGTQRRGTGTALAAADALGADGTALPRTACRARIRFEYFSDTVDRPRHGAVRTIVVQVHNITRADGAH